MADDPVESLRQKIFGSGDNILYQHIGYFFTWFSSVELRVTLLLSIMTEVYDLVVFDLLTRGLDARNKVNRLRLICKKRKRPIDKESNFGVRLSIFHGKMVDLRNSLSHSGFAISESGEPRAFILSLSRMPYKAFGEPMQFGEEPEEITFADLFKYGVWLNRFSDDLLETIHRAKRGESLDIENPRSWAPLEPSDNQSRKDDPAKHRKRTQLVSSDCNGSLSVGRDIVGLCVRQVYNRHKHSAEWMKNSQCAREGPLS